MSDTCVGFSSAASLPSRFGRAPRRWKRLLTCAVAAALGACANDPYAAADRAPAISQAPMYFYPERGQDAGLQDRDRYECYRWSVGQTGFDPGMTTLSAPTPVRPRDGSGVAAGAVAGAVVGAAASSSRHGGEGAILGALFGALIGAIVQDSQARATQQAQLDLATRQATSASLENFRRAMSACMGGRGYRVG